MATAYAELFAALDSPFDPHEVKTRQAPGGRTFQYVTARTVMNRLDDVLGPENWWDDYVPSANSVMCRLTIRLPEGETVTKCDAGGYAGMADQGDDDKSGFSDAFKRAAAKFGVGRYLYRDGTPGFAREEHGEVPNDPPQRAQQGHYGPPAGSPAHSEQRERQVPHGGGNGRQNVPGSGRALFAWIKAREEEIQMGLLKYLNSWGKLHEFPGRIVDWDADQVAQAYQEAVRKIQAIQPGAASEPEEA